MVENLTLFQVVFDGKNFNQFGNTSTLILTKSSAERLDIREKIWDGPFHQRIESQWPGEVQMGLLDGSRQALLLSPRHANLSRRAQKKVWSHYGVQLNESHPLLVQSYLLSDLATQLILTFFKVHGANLARGGIVICDNWSGAFVTLAIKERAPFLGTVFHVESSALQSGRNPQSPECVLETKGAQSADAITAVSQETEALIERACHRDIEKPQEGLRTAERVLKSRQAKMSEDSYRIFSEGEEVSFFDKRTYGTRLLQMEVAPNYSGLTEKLYQITRENLWWYWQADFIQILERMDSELWAKRNANANLFLGDLGSERLNAFLSDKENEGELIRVIRRFEDYMAQKKAPQIAYLCMEYGVSHILKNYSGGLGILAGDHLKEASDLNIPLCAFGFAYRYGYFHQRINLVGRQESLLEEIDFTQAPWVPLLDEKKERIKVRLTLPQAEICIQAWRVAVGRVDLYLLDTDLPENPPNLRQISDQLYSGQTEHRVEQEYVLALGAFEFLKRMSIHPTTFHMNEGHTGFVTLARIRELMSKEQLSYAEALEYVRKTTIFTTHTPIPAGHDVFPFEMVSPYLKHFSDAMSVDAIRELSRGLEAGKEHLFSMTGLAARCSYFINGVSQIHAEVSRKMFQVLSPDIHYSEVPVLGITNGIHAPTWVAPNIQKLFDKHLGTNWRNQQVDPLFWKKLTTLDSAELWKEHLHCKSQLLTWLRKYISNLEDRYHGLQDHYAKALASLSEGTLVITFARRFAPYKRASLLFRDLERVSRILNMSQKPMLFIFAGKAHPKDIPGQDIIARVIELSKQSGVAGRVLFVENYEMDVARLLVSGSDVWINNPLRPLEASGTSGMKAAMNGCLNFSVPDGWWAEGYNGENGWSIGTPEMTGSLEEQDLVDSELLYSILENEIVPTYFNRDRSGIPQDWVRRMKNSIETLLPSFSTSRMLADYDRLFYSKAREGAQALKQDSYSGLKDLVARQYQVQSRWAQVEVKNFKQNPADLTRTKSGDLVSFEFELFHAGIRPEDLSLEVHLVHAEDYEDRKTYLAECTQSLGEKSLWRVVFSIGSVGHFELAFRLASRFNTVKWL